MNCPVPRFPNSDWQRVSANQLSAQLRVRVRPVGLPSSVRPGIAVLFVLAVLCVTLAISYALSRSSVTTSSLSLHESGALHAQSAAETSVTDPFLSLRSNPNWMPNQSTTAGSFAADERHQVTLEVSDNGQGRVLHAAAQVYNVSDLSAIPNAGTYSTTALSISARPMADQHLQIRLAKQTRNDLPTSAITAFETSVNLANDAPVYIASGNSVRGDVRSKGPIYFQEGFKLEGAARVLGTVSRSGTDSTQYVTYRASWGTTYSAESLAKPDRPEGEGTLHLNNVLLGPSSTNPMGVFYCKGDELILDDSVQISGTLVVQGNLTIKGTGINLVALRQALVPPNPTTDTTATGLTGNTVSLDLLRALVSGGPLPLEFSANTVLKTTFPAVVVDGNIEIETRADAVRISGLILAGSSFHRQANDQGTLFCNHNHSIALNSIPDPFNTTDGPAVYIRGAIMAGRVHLEHRSERPFALVFDPAVTDVRDAPGFFSWRVAEWTEAN